MRIYRDCHDIYDFIAGKREIIFNVIWLNLDTF
jgi:hypothetical protein